MKSKFIALVLLGLMTTLAACEPQGGGTDTTSPSPEETTTPAETPSETATPSETPADGGTSSTESPSPSPS